MKGGEPVGGNVGGCEPGGGALKPCPAAACLQSNGGLSSMGSRARRRLGEVERWWSEWWRGPATAREMGMTAMWWGGGEVVW